MKYYLIIMLWSNGHFEDKVLQGPFVNKPACVAAGRLVYLPKGDPRKVTAECYSEAHITGRSVDPGKTQD